MSAQKTSGRQSARGGARTRTRQAAAKLPPVTVAKLEQVGYLMERLVKLNQRLFIEKGQEYKEAHREGSSRPLSPVESAQIASVLRDENTGPVEAAQSVQDSTLRAYDEPPQREILMSVGIGVAPKFVEAVRGAVALIELPAEVFEEACESDTLEQVIDERADELSKLELGEGRKRASAAFDHFAKAAGFESGEAMRLPVQAVWQALGTAIGHLTAESASSQLTDSAASTAGTGEMSSTD